MDNITALLQERASKVAEFERLTDEAEKRGKITAEDRQNLDSIHAVISDLDARVRACQPLTPISAPVSKNASDALTRDMSFAEAYEARHGGFGMASDGFAEARDFSLGKIIAARAGRLDHRQLNDLETRALAEGSGPSGGFAVPEILASKIIDRVRNSAKVIQAGALTVPMDAPTLNLARLVGGNSAEWKAENAPATESDQVFERVTLKAKTAVSLMRLSQELFEDLSPEGLRVVEVEIAQALALKLDFAALRGNPAGDDPDAEESPRGVRYQTGVNVIDLGENGLKPTNHDFLIDAISAIRDENGTVSSAILASRTLTTLDKLKDTTGQPLRQPEAVAALTKLVSNQVPVNLDHGTSHDTSEVYVGGFENVLIGVRPQLGIQFRVLNERYADNLQIGLLAWLRADVALAHPEHLSVVTGIKA